MKGYLNDYNPTWNLSGANYLYDLKVQISQVFLSEITLSKACWRQNII